MSFPVSADGGVGSGGNMRLKLKKQRRRFTARSSKESLFPLSWVVATVGSSSRRLSIIVARAASGSSFALFYRLILSSGVFSSCREEDLPIHFITAMIVAAINQCFVPFVLTAVLLLAFVVFIRRAAKRKNAPTEEEEEEDTRVDGDTTPSDKPSSPRKYRRKSYKKKKNRGANIPPVQVNEQLVPEKMENQQKTEDSEKHRKGAFVKRKYRKNTAPESQVCQNKPVKFYETLPIFTKLQLDQLELYNRLFQYSLHPKQLEDNGFPVECPDNPGKVVFGGLYRYASDLQNPNQRLCSRCSQKFTVSDDGLYEADTDCCYHSGKRLSVNGVSGAGAYSCCGSYENFGCTTGKCHVSGQIALTNTTFVKTREKRQGNNHSDKIFALDCEMCYTVQGLEVTRISVVGTDGLTVYDSYVLPENPVIDYNTAYSGITANDLKDVKTTLADVQVFLLKLLNARTILIGHGLENDLRALHLIHNTIVDTSVVFPHTYGLPYKRSLKTLAASYLKQSIQHGKCGHDSVEDARACMELMLWKIELDSHMQPPLIQHNSNIIPFSISPMPQQWAMSAFTSPNFTPCHFNYFVPPVGSPCALC